MKGLNMVWTADGSTAQVFEFDVGVSVSESETNEGIASVFAALVVAGVRGRSEEESRNISRLKFSVPVLLPGGNPGQAEHDSGMKVNTIPR